MSTFKNWILATRPKTLVAAIIPVVCATALAIRESSLSEVNLWVALLILFATMFIQIGTNLVNDAIDFHKGADTEKRLGPKRVTQSGIFKPKTVMRMGIFCFFAAMILGIPLAMIGGFPIVLIGLVSIMLGYCYTGGPYPIAYKGLGEIFVFLFFGFMAICGTYYLLRNQVTIGCLFLSLQIGGLSSVILAVNNYRDYLTDRVVNKMTLAARFGPKFAQYEVLFLFLLVFVCNIYWLVKFGFILLLLGSIAKIPAFFVVRGVFIIKPSVQINKYLGLSALTELVFGLCITIGFLQL